MRVSISDFNVVRKLKHTSSRFVEFLEPYLKDVYLND